MWALGGDGILGIKWARACALVWEEAGIFDLPGQPWPSRHMGDLTRGQELPGCTSDVALTALCPHVPFEGPHDTRVVSQTAMGRRQGRGKAVRANMGLFQKTSVATSVTTCLLFFIISVVAYVCLLSVSCVLSTLYVSSL